MGRFIGLRVDGRLAALAGERIRFPSDVEGLGFDVCTVVNVAMLGHGAA